MSLQRPPPIVIIIIFNTATINVISTSIIMMIILIVISLSDEKIETLVTYGSVNKTELYHGRLMEQLENFVDHIDYFIQNCVFKIKEYIFREVYVFVAMNYLFPLQEKQ
jgi:hypothetical protein